MARPEVSVVEKEIMDTMIEKHTPSAPATPSRAELSEVDNQILNTIVNEHHIAPSDNNLDAESLLSLVTDFLNGAVTGDQAHLRKVKAKAHQAVSGVPAEVIGKFCCEMKCGCKVSEDKHLREITLSMFSKLSNYSWESKAVLALFAYAIKYGDFLLLDQIYQETQNNQKLVEPMTILKKLVFPTNPSMIGLPKKHREITTTILEVTKLTVQIKNYNHKDVPPLSEAKDKLPAAVYLTIKTIIACASQFSSLDIDIATVTTTTTTATDKSQPPLLSTLHYNLTKILGSLKVLLCEIERFFEGAEKNRYESLWKLFVSPSPTDEVNNVRALKAIIYDKDDMLIKISTKTTVKIDDLQNKLVLLFISGLDISMQESYIDILKKAYNNADSKVHEEDCFEMVWIPVVDQRTEEAQKKFEKLKAEMPWYTVHNFSVTDGAVLRFLKQVWHFRGKPIVTVLNLQGKVESENAMHMINVWGWKAFPFTDMKQKELSDKISEFTLDVISEGVHSDVTNWIKQKEFILLYGGPESNEGWEEEARALFKRTETTIRIVNVHGNLRFWNRLESLLFSKMHSHYYKVDAVFHQIQRLFGYNNKLGTWAMLFKGPNVVISGEANYVLDVCDEKDFIKRINEDITALDRGCYRYWFLGIDGKVPKRLECLKCERTMGKYVIFQCCHEDEGAISNFH